MTLSEAEVQYALFDPVHQGFKQVEQHVAAWSVVQSCIGSTVGEAEGRKHVFSTYERLIPVVSGCPMMVFVPVAPWLLVVACDASMRHCA